MEKQHTGRCVKVKRHGVMVCDKGCDYLLAREADQKHCEKITGCKLDEPFFVMDGIQLIAGGGEQTCVFLKVGESNIELYEAQLVVWERALRKARLWIEKGYAPGIC